MTITTANKPVKKGGELDVTPKRIQESTDEENCAPEGVFKSGGSTLEHVISSKMQPTQRSIINPKQ